MTHDVFISFSFADQAIAEDIVNILTSKYGISCWICTREVDGGKRYKRLIPDAIRESNVVVFLQSEDAVESKEIPKEIGIAFDADKTIIPFKLDQAQLKGDMEYDLYGVEYIDATIPTMEQRIHDLAKSISKAINKPLLTDSENMAPKSSLKSSKINCSEIFAGRDVLLEDIHTAFEDRNVVFLHGMGGIGKSELARQYWKKHKDFYSTVVFARYDNSIASLIADDKIFNIEGTARKTKEGNVSQTDEEYALDKLAVLKSIADEHTLIIIDNFDVSIKDDPFFEEVVSVMSGRILVTTRCEPDKKKYHVISVGEIDDEDLKDLFIQYANPQKTIIEADDPDFDELFQLTNRHTYTLELIAKFMEENDDIDYISEMIDFLKEHGFSDIEVNGYDNICKLFRFTSLDDNEKYFLRCLSMMSPAGISQKLFKKWIDSGFSSRSRLVDLGLVKINGETRTIALHPIVREVVLNELNPSYENCKDFVNRCAMVGQDANPLMWELSYGEKVSYLECYTSILNFLTDINPNTYPVYFNISYMYNFIGAYEQTIALHERIYAFTCSYFGKNSHEAMLVCDMMAWKYANYMLYDRAMPYYEIASKWFYDNPCYTTRNSHATMRNCASNCYYMYEKTKDQLYLRKALDYLKNASVYAEKMIEATSHAPESFKMRLKYQNDCLCLIYFNLYVIDKKYDLANECLEKFKQIVLEFESKSGESLVTDMATYYKNYALLKYEVGEYEKSKEAWEEAYKRYLHSFGKTSRTINILEKLVMCCIKLNDYEEANKYLSLAIESASAIFTEDHPTLVRLLKLQEHN